MVKIYVRKIENGEMTLADVPTIWRAKAELMLAAIRIA